MEITLHEYQETEMAPAIDLKKIERRAYLSYHNDGLLDIAIGLIILLFGIGLLIDIAWIVGIAAAAGYSLFTAAKKAITLPRVGQVRFGPERTSRIKRENVTFQVYFSFAVLLGIVLFLVLSKGSLPDWMMNEAGRFLLSPLGLIGAVALALMAWWKQSRRYYAYAGLLAMAVFLSPILKIEHHSYMIATGVVMILAGAVLLTRFLRTYPLPAKED